MIKKLLKKILKFIGVLIIIGVMIIIGLICYQGFMLQAKEPEFRQYVTMTTEDQNAYALKFFNEIYGDTIPRDSKAAEKIIKANQEFESNPEALQAKIKLARSLVARFTLKIGNISEDLSPEVLKQLQEEHGEYKARLAEYHKFIRAYVQNQT
jgi:hypothetical protein